MASEGIRFFPDLLRSFDSATFSGSYQAVGGPLPQNARVVKFTNNSSVGITLSWDGVNDHEFLPPNSGFVIDVTTNRDSVEEICLIVIGTQFYAKGSAGSGLLYISNYYTH